MNVKLVSWTNNPKKVIYWAFMNMHNRIPDTLDNISLSSGEEDSFFDMLLKQPHQTVLEFVNTVWYIDGASRAFQQQLTRTRQASYSIQSLRIVDCAKSDYHTPEACRDSEVYHNAMQSCKRYYSELITAGIKPEDARGVLPLNINSPITMSINLRSLYHMLELRMCNNTQEEFREVAKLMKAEISEKLGEVFSKYISPPCYRIGECNSAVSCNKYGFKKKITTDVSAWLKG